VVTPGKTHRISGQKPVLKRLSVPWVPTDSHGAWVWQSVNLHLKLPTQRSAAVPWDSPAFTQRRVSGVEQPLCFT